MGGVTAGCLAMMISITTSGGIGGFGLARSVQASVENLPEPLRTEACSRLDPRALGALRAVPTRGADRVVYHIVITQPGGGVARFDLGEGALPADTLDLIDALLAEHGTRP